MSTSSIKSKSKKSPAKKSSLAKEDKPKKSETLIRHLQENFGFDTFKEPQEEIIESLLSGRDTFVIMPTGEKKSLYLNFPTLITTLSAVFITHQKLLIKVQ